MTCRKKNEYLADLLLEPESASAAVKQHVAQCAECAPELSALKETMRTMDAWQAPEPGAFFDARLYARLRTEAAGEPAGWMERLRARMLYSSRLAARQWAAAALALALAVGGGTFALLDHGHPAPVVEASATVRDLQSFDGNAQFFQQMNALNASDSSSNGASN